MNRMDPQVSTSFIPKKQFDGGSNRSRGLVGVGGLVLLIAILIFIAALVAAGGVFTYKKLLTQSIASMSASLALNEKAYDPGVIQELSRSDARINEAQGLLGKHLAPSAIFAYLGMQTLERVQFTTFSYSLKQDGSADIALGGVADSFSTVALQSDQFSASKVLKDVVFSGVNIDSATGQVAFSVSANLAASVINYAKTLNAGSASGADTASSTPQTQ